MKKRLLICIALCIISVLCALGLVACGGGKGNDNGEVTVDGVVYSLNDDKASYTLKEIKNPTAANTVTVHCFDGNLDRDGNQI